jgi:hypothetical protein
VAVVADALGEPLDDATTSAVRGYLDAHPQGAHGEHRYSFDDLGLDPTEARAGFARYQSFFDVPNEV